MTEEAKMFKALGDENRLFIFKMISGGEICACKILEQLHISQPTLSRHMKVLVDCGLVKVRKDAQWMRYSINEDAVRNLDDFLKGIVLPGTVADIS